MQIQQVNKNKSMTETFSSSSSTAFAMSFFCSNASSRSSFGTVALMTEISSETLRKLVYLTFDLCGIET